MVINECAEQENHTTRYGKSASMKPGTERSVYAKIRSIIIEEIFLFIVDKNLTIQLVLLKGLEFLQKFKVGHGVPRNNR